ncbi:beta-lactamase family protein [Mycolicibacillus parakoreensis]|uniref:Beta-lactamase family protein n=1 Tax=Mycolicibacillus parakoreensis TaxID=1069221 RepID=A0ABY3TXB2_9MYCO|nr:serine hydrolase domain-containing protein [Mycolicibacillus parakoreensis]MCV7316883.1 beta-lactamase family protein [Mycolicibacillus parakoreensis]ULN51238.1 beta-lactamase family protein [Mycolicibacillus parakoreensis]HLR98884.1 serine hydrolase domain-containing protein [Mycolicibacillus parakoreensis]
MNLEANRAPIAEACDAGLLAGAVTVVWQRGRVLQVNEIGYRDVAAGLPMTGDTVFRIASMTKPVTVAAAMRLVDAGRLALDDPITRWVPEFARMSVLADPAGPLDAVRPAERPLTVEDLMTHRAGLAYGFTVTGPIAQAYRRLPFGRGPDAWIAALAELPLVHQPGARMTYGHGSDVLGVLISRVEDKPVAEVLAEQILEPVGMGDTGFHLDPAQRARAATMYGLDRSHRLRDDVMGPPPITPPPFPNAGGGLWSTAEDYLRFARMLLADGVIDGHRVLSSQSVALMRTDRLTAEQKRHPFLGAPFWQGRGFGLNLSVVTDPARSRPLYGPGAAGTFSWPGAYGTWWQADPSAELILLYLVQNQPTLSASAAAAVAGNTSIAALQTAQPKFVHRTYRALDLL